jgi:hypothetical protein
LSRENHGKNKGKPKQPAFNAKQNTVFKKKKDKAELPCFTCGELGHFAKDCLERADKKEKKKVNLMTTSSADDGYGNFPTVLSVFQSQVGGLIHVLIFTCVLISLYFLLIRGSKVPPS